MRFPPIAVVGHGCVLPDALTPRALWDTVVAARTAVSSVPEGRWGVAPGTLRSTRQPDPDRVRTDVGGFVRDFDSVFRPRALGWDAWSAARLAPLFRWTVHAVAEALGPVPGARHSTRTGLVMGNLTYPTASLATIALRQWQTGNAFPSGRDRTGTPDPLNRFCFGEPAVLAGRLLGLGAGTLTLDAACASSLYAVKLACDRLHDGEADVMVAGGASGADSLFIHMGFTALGALSGRGRSLPLDRRADGLVPAEGAAFVTLMRLPDALARDIPVLAVIRGIGCTASGRRGSILAPDQDAQERAMHRAYQQAGVAPERVGLLECHATGTPLGDAVEIRSSNRVFAAARHLAAGSSKANFGHALPAAGAVGLLKVVEALRTGVIPPVTGVEEPSPELSGGPLRLPTEPEDWTGPRVAALSAFGFGGSNAHVVLEGWPPRVSVAAAPPAPGARTAPATADAADGTEARQAADAAGGTAAGGTVDGGAVPSEGTSPAGAGTGAGADDVVVVGLGVRLGGGADVTDFARDLAAGRTTAARADRVRLALDKLPFPPADFIDAHPEQGMLLAACQEAVAGLRLPGDRTLIMVGAETTPDTARYRSRWQRVSAPAERGRGSELRSLCEPLTANSVMRHMGAILAGQINFAWDLTAPGFALSARESSGLAALRLATRAIRAGEADAAVVGAVAMPDEDVHRSVLSALDQTYTPVNAAVVAVVKSARAARRDGDRVLAVIPPPDSAAAGGPARLTVGDVPAAPGGRCASVNTAEMFGHADCAHGMVSVAVAVVALSRALLPRRGAAAVPWLGERAADIVVQPAQSVGTDRLRLHAAPDVPRAQLTEPVPRLHVYSGTGKEAVLESARSYREDGRGPARLVVQACGEAQLRDRVEAAVHWLRGVGRRPDGVHYRSRPVGGEVAFVYTGGAAAYQGMGRALLLACPDVAHSLAERCGPLDGLVQWLYEPSAGTQPTAMQLIWAATVLSRLHTSISRDTLGLLPHSVLGYSSGAASALISLGYWRQLRSLAADSRRDPLFNGLLTGPCEAVRAVWRRAGIQGTRWATHLVGAAPERVRAALHGEPAVHLTAVNSPTCCTIGGEAEACRRVLDKLDAAYAFQLAYDVVAHAPEVGEVADRWRAFHHRATERLPRVRFHDCATGRWRHPTAEGIAEALTVQATRTVNFAATVEQAYADGARVFIEHGPKQLCTGWTSEILRGREHLAVALDGASGQPVRHLFDVAGRLLAAGVPVRHEALTRRFTPPPSHLARAARTITVAAHLPAVTGTATGGTAASSAAAPAPVRATTAAGDTHGTGGGASVRDQEDDASTRSVAAPVPAAAVSAVMRADTGVAGVCEADRAASQGTTHTSPPASPAPRSASFGSPGRPTRPAPPPPPSEPSHQPAPRPHTTTAVGAAAAQATTLGGPAGRGPAAALACGSARADRAPARLPVPAPAADRPSAQDEAVAPARRPDAVTAPSPTPPSGTGPAASAPRDRPPATHRRAIASGRTASMPLTPAPPPHTGLPGPRFDRAQLERLAHGPVSEVFGPLFRPQDGRRRQTRLPRPPMLLVDRVTGIDAEPGSLGTGVIWTETDIRPDAWYLDPAGRMAPAMTVEAGQADLLLISWLGIDLRQTEDRVYRLLGCDLTFHGPLPVPGDTLRYRIEITGHARHAGVHLFFFQYDCWVGDEPRISVRNGQAGFFTDHELGTSAGVLWTPDALVRDGTAPRAASDDPGPGRDPDPRRTRAFGCEQVAAFAQGRPADCFGPGWESTRSHLRTPRIADDRHQLIRRVTHFDPAGGPAGAGYLRAELPLTGGEWFFDGHFHNDPCMPGTLMLEGGYQAMAFHLAALGLTTGRDGWRFEPVPHESVRMRCRGQAVPGNELLVYELFVRAVEQGPEPVIRADLLCTVDGRKSFHAEGLALSLVPDTPLDQWRTLVRADAVWDPAVLPVPVTELRARPPAGNAVTVDGTLLDRDSMLASAWGSPREAMGPAFASLRPAHRFPRLPGPPYLCVDRVTALRAEAGRPVPGSQVETEFELAEDAWFWQDCGGTLPMAILMEAALQPCGWLAQFTGCAPNQGKDLFFRNLDGTTSVLRPVPAGTRVLRTRATLREVTTDGSMVLVFFDVTCTADGEPALTCATSFGYFPAGAFDTRTGLGGGTAEEPSGPADRDAGDVPDTDLTVRPEKYCTGPLRIGHPMLVTPDRATRCRPAGGAAGLGSVRGEQDVRGDSWYFRAHFYQDPVQPGSLGIEAMYQLLRVLLIEKDFAAGMRAPAFEPLAGNPPLTWKYRGQVTPASRRVVIDLEITETGETQEGRYAVAQAWLTVDGLRIYHVRNIGLRVTDTAAPSPPDHFAARVLDASAEPWLCDHRPTHTTPTLPMTCVADVVAQAAHRHTGRTVRAVEQLAIERWIVLDTPRRLLPEVRATSDRTEVRLLLWRQATTPALSRYEQVATAVVRHETGRPPELPPPLSESRPALCLPYEDGALFHGPAFRSLVGLRRGLRGSTGVIQPARCRVPYGVVAPGLLDAALHIVPHQAFEGWDARIAPGKAGFPRRLVHLRLYEPLPTTGAFRVDARFAGCADDDPDRPVIDLFLHRSGRVLATMRVEENLLPLGFLARYDPSRRQAFLRDRVPLPGPGIGRGDGTSTTVTSRDVSEVDWFPGTVRTVFGVPEGTPAGDMVAEVAAREHVARRCGVHPSLVSTSAGRLSARSLTRPLTRHHLITGAVGSGVTVREAAAPSLDIGPVTRWWRARNGGDWDGLVLLSALIRGFLTELELGAPVVCEPRRSTGRLYVSGPDVDPAALVFAAVNSAERDVPTLLLGGGAWTRRLLRLVFDSPRTRLDPRTCPCADPAAPPAERAAAHLAHGGDVLWPLAGDMPHGTDVEDEVVREALRTGAPVHPVSYRPMAAAHGPDTARHLGPRTVRPRCHHLLAGALPPAALAREPSRVVRAVLRTLDEVPVRSLVGAVPPRKAGAGAPHRHTTDAATDEALLSVLVRDLPRVPGRSAGPLVGRPGAREPGARAGEPSCRPAPGGDSPGSPSARVPA
ncbi:beta-ketoacyl synthase N-terminal-like domain-containing protein [Streptomyces rubradiris]|uniref:beta-ketoacyl synthase N-terminal-like domain-containing protein n=1 Tax=Streptomyces rubradiris TaxID=285531 RepID=UPI003407A103